MTPNEVETLARRLVLEHLGTTWTWGWDRAVKRLGACHYDKNKITMSRPLIESGVTDEKVMDNILHEIAHALTPGDGHGPLWRKQSIALGGRGERCYTGADVTPIAKPWIGTCPNCGHIYTKHRRRDIACTPCCDDYSEGKYDPQYKVVWARA